MKNIFFLVLIYSFSLWTGAWNKAFGQIGGIRTFKFLNLPPSARAGALGGTQIAFRDEDVSMAYQNPSLLHAKMDKQVSLNATLFFAGIKYGYAGYADHFGKDTIGSNPLRFSGGVQYIDYGKFIAADSTGGKTGEFEADEYAFHFALQKQDKKWSYGSNLKLIYSALEQNSASAVAVDLATTYTDTTQGWILAFVVKNLGTPIRYYRKSNHEKLPFEMQFGFSRKLEHLPFRFSMLIHNLQQFNIRYDNPADREQISLFSTDTTAKEKKYILDKIARHFIVAGEFSIAKAARLDFAYNHLRRQELRMTTKSGWAGFSFGLGIQVNRFSIHYGRAIYHVAGGTNHFSISMNVGGILKKKFFSVLD